MRMSHSIFMGPWALRPPPSRPSMGFMELEPIPIQRAFVGALAHVNNPVLRVARAVKFWQCRSGRSDLEQVAAASFTLGSLGRESCPHINGVWRESLPRLPPLMGPRIWGCAGGCWGLHSGGRRVALVPSAPSVSMEGGESADC